MKLLKLSTICICAAAIASGCATNRHSDAEFKSVFDGQTLKGWILQGKKGDGYGVTNGAIFCSKGGGGNLLTEKEYSDFVFRFEFKLDPGANNGVGIRAPLEGDAAYLGMEIQVLEEAGALAGRIEGGAQPNKQGKLRPEQLHGSIYDVVAAKTGAQKPAGEWNSEEITAIGRNIKVVVNGIKVLDSDINDITDPKIIRKHPGLFRERGHIGFLGHNDHVEFRNIQIKDLCSSEKQNVPPDDFVALFNGKDLKGWKGLLKSPNDNPIKRAALSPAEHQAAQKLADEDMRANWSVVNGQIVFSGKGRSLCTVKDYADFEMLVDWKLPAHGDSGIYLRGTPQVQIWDPHTQPTKHGSEVGSGAFYNNKNNPSKPLRVADKPIGEWNRFRILMVGERAHVFLNGELVTRDTVLENFWKRADPIFASGQIELQNHGDGLEFKNMYIRERSTK